MALHAGPAARPGRGRQRAEVEDLRDRREEFTAVVSESREYAERVLQIGLELTASPMLSRQHILNLGGELIHRSGRRLAQLSSVVL